MAANGIGISDVARKAGVSTATVSRVLSSGQGGRETRKRVLDVARNLGYRRLRRPAATNSSGEKSKDSSKSTGIIAMLASRTIISNAQCPPSFYHRLWSGIEEKAREHGYYVIACSHDPDEDFSLPDVIKDRRVDGMLLADHFSSEFVSNVSPFTTLVMVNNYLDWPAINSVMVDNWKMVFLAVQHLVQLGHNQIAHFEVGKGSVHVVQRRQAFLSAIEHFNLCKDADLCEPEKFGINEHGPVIAAAMDRYFRRNEPPTAIIASSMYNMCFLREAVRMGIEVPRQLSLVGLGDQLAEVAHPALTTIRIPYEESGRIGVEMLLSLLENQTESTITHVSVQPKLIVRDSTAIVNNE